MDYALRRTLLCELYGLDINISANVLSVELTLCVFELAYYLKTEF